MKLSLSPKLMGKTSENICKSSRGVQEQGKTEWNSVYHQNWWEKLVKIYAGGAVEAFRKKERQNETQFITKIDGKN